MFRPGIASNRGAIDAAPPVPFDPVSLFGGGEDGGIWISDKTTLRSGTGGVTATTTAGNSVSRRMSQHADPGAELWIHANIGIEGESQILGNQSYRLYSSAGVASTVGDFGPVDATSLYLMTFTIDSVVAGTLQVGNSLATFNTTGTKTCIVAFASGTQMYVKRNSGATDITFSNVSVKRLASCMIQDTSGNRPIYQDAPDRIDYVSSDTLAVTFDSDLGSNVTVARSVPGSGASILTAQTVGTSYSDTTDNCALVIIDRALTGGETADLTAWLDAQAGL